MLFSQVGAEQLTGSTGRGYDEGVESRMEQVWLLGCMVGVRGGTPIGRAERRAMNRRRGYEAVTGDLGNGEMRGQHIERKLNCVIVREAQRDSGPW